METTTLPRIFQRNIQNCPNNVAQYSKDKNEVFQPSTFTDVYNEILTCAAGFREEGIKRGDHVGLISDNRKEWLIIDIGLLSLGATNVPRGCDTMSEEMAYILSFGDCKAAVLENEAQLQKIIEKKDKLQKLSTLIMIDNNFDKEKYAMELTGVRITCFKDLMDKGRTSILSVGASIIEAEIEKGKTDDVATIIFTSGTTGEPKGVMLSHKNLLNQAMNAAQLIGHRSGDTWMTVLPIWHVFERAIQYIALYEGCAIAYSKPVGKIMLEDFKKIRPQWMTAVPRIWEALCAGVYRNAAAGGKTGVLDFFVSVSAEHEIYKNLILGRTPQYFKRVWIIDILVAAIPFLILSPLRGLGNLLVFKKIKVMFGGKFKAGISGGAALPGAVDKFFAAAGIGLLEGYGLTETAPILGVRKYSHPVPGTIGPPFTNMEIEIRDPETGKKMKPGHNGILYAKGQQVMLGYYKKPEETKKVVSDDGWLNTGDIGMKTWKGEIRLTGRAKDTIVLLGGENVEPVPIENKIRDSEYIDHAVVLGQDQKFLGALIVPNFEKIEGFAKENNLTYMDNENLVKLPEIKELLQTEITERVNRKTGFRGFEMVFRSIPLSKTFEVGKELSSKQDYKRHSIANMYKKEIEELFSE